ncbi:hypothetical protein KAW18_15015, partial [candidate division WOR-3 bacterium]|nr:hypothetical protein [candidate division WOR-3 bacterium]
DMGLTAGMEQDIVWRIEKAGYNVMFEPTAAVYISMREDFKKYIKQAYSRQRGGMIIRFKHPDKITSHYLFSMLYLPIIIIVTPILFFLFNIKLFIYLVMIVSILPIGYYLIRMLKGRRHIKKTTDMIFILIIGYIWFVSVCLGILRGCFDILKYKEKLMSMSEENRTVR